MTDRVTLDHEAAWGWLLLAWAGCDEAERRLAAVNDYETTVYDLAADLAAEAVLRSIEDDADTLRLAIVPGTDIPAAVPAAVLARVAVWRGLVAL